MLVKKYHDSHCKDKELLISIHKAMDSSPELRSKRELIDHFIAGLSEVDDVMNEWNEFVAKQRENDLASIIQAERLKPQETREFMEN